MEVHTENYMGGGTPLRYLDAIRRDTPISLHGVGLSLGSAEGIDPAHLERIRKVAERIEPGLMSEHIAWNVVGGTYLADLLPLPMTEEALEVVCRHVDQTQTYLRRRILVENPSTYVAFGNSIIPEWEFMTAVAARTGCGILCDVNNICVSAHNHGWDASAYIAALPPDAVGEIHLAGHSIKTLADGSSLRIDDHGSRVSEEVWSLYRQAHRALRSCSDPDRMGQRRAAAGRPAAGGRLRRRLYRRHRRSRSCRRCLKCRPRCRRASSTGITRRFPRCSRGTSPRIGLTSIAIRSFTP